MASTMRLYLADAVGMNRLVDILKGLSTEIGGGRVNTVAHLIEHGSGDANAARWREAFEARRR